MSMLHTRGIVFRTVKYGETSVITDVFTEEKGLLTFIAGSVRAARSRMPFGLFQPMTVLDTVSYFSPKGGGGMHRLKEARIAETFRTIPFDARRGGVALFMAEICRKCIRESEENADLFAFLLDYLRVLDDPLLAPTHLPAHFLAHFSALIGFSIEPPERYSPSLRFHPREGLFQIDAENAALRERGSDRYLYDLLHTPLDQIQTLEAAREIRKTAFGSLLLFYQTHAPDFGELRSPEVLEWVLRG